MTKIPDLSEEITVANSWMQGGTSCTFYRLRNVSYTERFYYNGGCRWWFFAGTGKKAPRPPAGATVEEDGEFPESWWFTWGYPANTDQATADKIEAQFMRHLFKRALEHEAQEAS